MNNAIPFVLYEHAAGFAVAPPRLWSTFRGLYVSRRSNRPMNSLWMK